MDAAFVVQSGDVQGTGQALLSLIELCDTKRAAVRSVLTVEAPHSAAVYDVVVTRRTDRQ